MRRQSIQKTVKSLFEKVEQRKQLQAQIEAIDAELAEYGIKPEVETSKRTAKSKGATRKRVSDEQVMKCVTKEGVNAKAVADALGCSKLTATKKLDGLASAKKIHRIKEGKAKTAPVTYKLA